MRLKTLAFAAVLLTGAVVFWGCEWSSGDSDFNTSKGAGAAINISGVYNGTQSGKAVSSTSNGTITYFNLTQSGNRIDVVDNQGSSYSGSVGTPILASLPSSSTVVPAGWLAAQYQVSWTGKDVVAAVDIQFSGVIDVVTVENVYGSESSSSSESSADIEFDSEGTNSSQVIIRDEPAGDGTTNRVIIVTGNSGDTTTNASKSVSTSGSTTTTFGLSEANSQYRLRGTWIEAGGRSSSVSCVSPGNAGSVTVD